MITIERARQILASYGGNPSRWPEEERAAMQQLLSNHSQLQELQHQALQLDEQLAEMFTAEENTAYQPLAGKILANLPNRPAFAPQAIPQPLSKLRNRLRALFAPPAPAWSLAGATLTLLLAFAIFQFGQQPLTPEPQPANGENAWLLMADALDNSADLELLAVLEPELVEDDLDIL